MAGSKGRNKISGGVGKERRKSSQTEKKKNEERERKQGERERRGRERRAEAERRRKKRESGREQGERRESLPVRAPTIIACEAARKRCACCRAVYAQSKSGNNHIIFF